MSPVSGRVLVVEDDDAVRMAVDRGLGVHGFDVSSVPDAESAIEVVARRRPDVMIVDIGLPGMSGVELCTRLRGLDVDTPILILSARDQVGDRVAGLQAGADDYGVKPFSLDELAARVHALLRRARPAVGVTSALAAGPLWVDLDRRVATAHDTRLDLSRREFDLLAASITLLAVGALFRGYFASVLQDRVDKQLEERADTAPILAAVAERLAQSELRTTLEGARVVIDGQTISLGLLPDDPLPAEIAPGWSTARASGDRWRLYAVEVFDVPQPGDQAIVQLVAPLGDVDARSVALRRRVIFVMVLTAVAAGLVGFLLGKIATRPLTALRRDTERIEDAEPSTWRVADAYGSAEVDDVAATLNENLQRLADETQRRGAALDAARAFAASATHELRTPLQGALTNLDIARSGLIEESDRTEVLELANEQLQRMAAALSAVRALADAEFADPSWFDEVDLADVADAAVADERRRAPDASIEIESTPPTTLIAWRDGARLAVANIVRNSLVHGVPADGELQRLVVSVAGATVTVDDNGPGVPAADRQRVLQRFERGGGHGSGLGLAIAHQVAIAHGGSVSIGASPLGGARVVLTLAPPGPFEVYSSASS